MASDTSTAEPAYGLHPYQRQVYRDILTAIEKTERRVVAHLPTGAGKTRVASHVAAHMLNSSPDDNALVIWLASSEELCEQAAETLGRAWQHLGQRDAAINRLWGQHRLDLRQIEGGFLIAGLAKLWAVSNQDNTWSPHLAQRAAGVIFDEAHQAVAPTYSFLTEQLIGSQTPLLGLTATPGRTTEVTDSDLRLADMFAQEKVSIDPKGHDSAVTYLIQSQYLAEPRFILKNFDTEVVVSEPRQGNDYRQIDLDKLGSEMRRNVQISEWATEALLRHRRIIVFCPSVESANECARLMRTNGVTAHSVTASTPQEERQRIIEQFKDDPVEKRIIFNYGLLTAGFDAPQTSCVIIARPTTSLVLYSQMVGRGLRGPRAGGNRWAEIITVVDMNLPGFGSVTDAFNNWEGIW